MLSIEEQVNNILKSKNVMSAITFGGKSYADILISESNRLKKMIEEEINKYYASYTPSVYKRYTQNHLIKKIRTNVDIANRTVSIYFDPSVSYGKSVITGNYDGYIPELIDIGWQVRADVWFSDIEMFGYYEGFHFIEKAILRFRADNPYGLNVEAKGSWKDYYASI